MAEQTKIQWADHTFNPWRGCQKIAPGCANCYADRQSKRNPAVLGIWGSEATGATRVVAVEDQWKQPKKWNENALAYWCESCEWTTSDNRSVCECGTPGEPFPRPRVFCASIADVFEDWQGPMVDSQGGLLVVDGGRWLPTCTGDTSRPLTMQDVRERLFSLIDATPNLDWLLLTKRPENVRRMWPQLECDGCGEVMCAAHRHGILDNVYRSNVWLGVSCSTQEDCDRLIPELLKYRGMAANLFVSLEPLIEPVDIVPWTGGWAYCCRRCGKWARTENELTFLGGDNYLCDCGGRCSAVRALDWVIVGGESGPNARPYHVDWARAVIQQCKNAGVACFHKQLGAAPLLDTYGPDHEGLSPRFRLGGLNDPKGGDMDEWPEDLRVREVPT